jgi:hypothetical protein
MNEKQKNLEGRPSRSQANLQGDSRTLHYELGMLIQLARGFDTPDIQKNRIVKNAFIESFAIHCRALIFFLFGHWKERTVNGEILRFIYLNSNDVIAFDFHPGWVQDCPEHTKVMAEAKHQTDKHVAHITEERRELNQPGSPKESSWDLHAATTAIYSALDCFLAKAPSENFDATRLHEMKKLINGWTAPTDVQTVLSVKVPGNPEPTHRNGLVSAVGTTSAESSEHTYNIHAKT